MTSLVRRLRARPWLSVTVAAVLVAGGLTGYLLSNNGSTAAAAAPSYRLVAATSGTIRQSVTTTGTVEPAAQDDVEFQVSGLVTSVKVTAGEKVNAGTVLATIDSAALKATLANANATLASAQARLSADESAGSASATINADQTAVTAATGQVSSANTALSEASLTSPIAGVVATVNLAVGQQVQASSGSGNAGSGNSGSGSGGANAGNSNSSSASASSTSAQFLVISTDSWIVDASVDDTQVGLVAVGDQAQVVPGGAGSTVYGTIASIGLIASSSSGVATYPVVVNVTGNPAGMHPGDTATVTLIYKQLANVLVVPTTAVHQRNGTAFVYEISGGKQVEHDVTVGSSSGGQSQITNGLSAGDQVVVPVVRVPGRSTSTTTNRGGGGFGGGGFGGGGFGGGGFGGGGLGGGVLAPGGGTGG